MVICRDLTDAPVRSHWFRTLKIKHLESDFGDILDLDDMVEDVFDDRSPNGDNRTSIVKVARYPPDPNELRYSARFGSLLPESTARPKKRSIEQANERLVQEFSIVPTIERWEEPRRPSKRPQISEAAATRQQEAVRRPSANQDQLATPEEHNSEHRNTCRSVTQVKDSEHPATQQRKVYLPKRR